ncbi:MAG: ABC transporter substrate-binding protein [Bacillota bacterium]|nr:ABC transporter substrate-binding protein [Bacillota bacterium]MDI7248674.1 ABC transporter substrate-binding protein [Bacillota bacterium]
MGGRSVRTLMALLVALALLGGAGCSKPAGKPGGGAAGPTVGGTYVMAVVEEPRTLDPAKMKLATEDILASYLGAGLLAVSPDGKIVPWLAKDWQVSDDGTTLTFHLKSGIKFHSGRPLKASDIKFSYERVLDPKTGSPVAADMLAGVTSVEAPDAETLILKLKEPNAALLQNLAGSSGYLQPVDPEEVAKWGDEYGTHPCSVGPFKLKEWKPGEYVVIERNPDYNWAPEFVHQGPPYLQEIMFKVMPEEATRVAAFESGELSQLGVPPQSWAKYQDNPAYQFFRVSSGFVGYVAYNFSKPLFQDLRVRRAIDYAIDREAILSSVYEGRGQVGYSPIHPGLVGYWKESEQPPYAHPRDLAKAGSLLDEAGWKDADGDGMREKDGKPLKLRLYTMPAGRWPLLAELVQAQLKEAGIATEITSYEFSTLLDYLQKGDYDLTMFGYTWIGGDAGDILNMLLNSAQAGKGLNISHYKNPAMDDLLARARRTLDQQERFEILRDIQKLFLEDAVWVTLVYPESAVAIHSRFQGVRVHQVFGQVMLDDVYVTEAK